MLPTCFVWVQTKTYNADTFYLPITYVLLVFIVIFIIRLIIHLLPKSIYATRNILVIGEEDNIKRVEAISEKSHTLKIKYTLQPDSINLNDNHLELLALCSEYNINEIIIALNEKRDVLPVHALMQCKLRGIEITDYLTLIEQETGFVDLDNFSPSWIIYSQDFSRNFASHAAKRIFDIFASLIILFLTSPILIITFFAVRQESEGGAFYKQTRVGLDGKNFEILKFRSMYIDAEKNGVQWAAENDPRITSVGKLIRKTRIDELPQLFNVLKGDMSLVGPRPERPEFVETLKQDITLYDERHLIKPGLTGWAQINNPYGASVDDTKQKLKLDLYYLKHGNIILDILILLKTLRVVFWPQGVR
jgi:sugar transferase (PEP-CTERM system associated)